MEVSAKNMEVFSKLISNSMRLDLKENFHNAHGKLSAEEFIHLNANSFLNESGINKDGKKESGTLECLKDIVITIGGMFKNTGGGYIEKDVPEIIQVYETVPVSQEELQKQAEAYR